MRRRSRSRAGIVLGKELRETFRDRRVVLAVVVSPLLVTPFIMALMVFFFGQKILFSLRGKSLFFSKTFIVSSLIFTSDIVYCAQLDIFFLMKNGFVQK